MVICSLFYVVSIIITCVICVPSPSVPDDDAAWLSKVQSCGPNEASLALAQGIFGTVSDVYLLVIPIQMLLRLHLALKRKLGICAVFATGVL